MDSSKDNITEVDAPELKLYKRRWFMLILFIIYSFNGSQQWAQFTIINNLVKKYYDVTTTQVEWTSNVYSVSYIILVFPTLPLIKYLGIRKTMILGASGITIGNWIKVLSVAPDRFYIAFIGQTFAVSFLMLAYGVLGRLISIWFGAKEISTAGSLSILGDLLGGAFAYIFPTVLVTDGSLEHIGNGLWNMHLFVSIVSTVILVLVLLFFEEKPKLPPSVAQIKLAEEKEEKLLPTLVKLMRNPEFLLYMVSFGLNCSTNGGLFTCMNELLEINFPGLESHAGTIGSVAILSGVISSLLAGAFLDKTGLFQESANILTSCTSFSLIFFTWSLKSGHIFYVYLAVFFIGFFVFGYYSVGVQLGLELTYPIHEGISTSIIFFFVTILGLLVNVVYSFTIKTYGDVAANILMAVLNVIASVITFLTPIDLKRQRAENEAKEKPKELKEFS